jgi:hypothetical protein
VEKKFILEFRTRNFAPRSFLFVADPAAGPEALEGSLVEGFFALRSLLRVIREIRAKKSNNVPEAFIPLVDIACKMRFAVVAIIDKK